MTESVDEVRHQNYFDATVDVVSSYLKSTKKEITEFYVVTMNIPTNPIIRHYNPKLEKFRLLDEEEVVDVNAGDISYPINFHYIDAIWLTGDKNFKVTDTCDQLRWVLDENAFQLLKQSCKDNVFPYNGSGFRSDGNFLSPVKGVKCWGHQVKTGTNTTGYVEKEIGSPIYAYDSSAGVVKIGFGEIFSYEWKKSWLGFGLLIGGVRLIMLIIANGIGTFFAHIGWFLGNAFGWFIAGLFICLIYCLIYATIRTIVENVKKKKAEIE